MQVAVSRQHADVPGKSDMAPVLSAPAILTPRLKNHMRHPGLCSRVPGNLNKKFPGSKH